MFCEKSPFSLWNFPFQKLLSHERSIQSLSSCSMQSLSSCVIQSLLRINVQSLSSGSIWSGIFDVTVGVYYDRYQREHFKQINKKYFQSTSSQKSYLKNPEFFLWLTIQAYEFKLITFHINSYKFITLTIQILFELLKLWI